MTRCRRRQARHIWQRDQLAKFDGKIKKEIAANEGSTLWRARLLACSVKKNHDMWEVQYAELDNYDRMPETSSTSYIWQKNQLSRFDGKIKKEIAAN